MDYTLQYINFFAGPDDAESFHLELRSFLNELKCYHEVLVTDLAALNEPGNRLILIGQLVINEVGVCLIIVFI